MQVLGCQSRRLPPIIYYPRPRLPQRDQWPSYNGTACLCYDTLNAECIATCAAGIRNYNIRQSSGTGLVTATCPQGTMVLGCGSATNTTGQSSRRAAVVAMRTSCRCYDDEEVTRYAVCGLFIAESSYPDSFAASFDSFDSDSFAARLLVPTKNSSPVKLPSISALTTVLLCILGLLLSH